MAMAISMPQDLTPSISDQHQQGDGALVDLPEGGAAQEESFEIAFFASNHAQEICSGGFYKVVGALVDVVAARCIVIR